MIAKDGENSLVQIPRRASDLHNVELHVWIRETDRVALERIMQLRQIEDDAAVSFAIATALPRAEEIAAAPTLKPRRKK
jgi:hypothetical protein